MADLKSCVTGRGNAGRSLTYEHPEKHETPVSRGGSLAPEWAATFGQVIRTVARAFPDVKQKVEALGLSLALMQPGGEHAILAS